MAGKISNLVFEGGGILGIAYLGVLDFFDQHSILRGIKKVAGTSAGAITACITSFNLPFEELKKIADSLDYTRVPERENPGLKFLPNSIKTELNKTFGDIDCVYRLISNYGWYSSKYFFRWLQEQIAAQFDIPKKPPPYTFADFRNSDIHKRKRPFFDLLIIGTDVSCKASRVFSYETTPNMEVAEAVRISMSIPLFFEALEVSDSQTGQDNVLCDGGVMRNYPINIFDIPPLTGQVTEGVNPKTLGVRFKSKINCGKITNILEYIINLVHSFLQVQQDIYNRSPEDIDRSIEINTGDISPVNFNIRPHDKTYNFLYYQGYQAAENYFQKRRYVRIL